MWQRYGCISIAEWLSGFVLVVIGEVVRGEGEASYELIRSRIALTVIFGVINNGWQKPDMLLRYFISVFNRFLNSTASH